MQKIDPACPKKECKAKFCKRLMTIQNLMVFMQLVPSANQYSWPISTVLREGLTQYNCTLMCFTIHPKYIPSLSCKIKYSPHLSKTWVGATFNWVDFVPVSQRSYAGTLMLQTDDINHA